MLQFKVLYRKAQKDQKAKKIRKKTKIKINLSNKNKKWNSSIIFEKYENLLIIKICELS